MTCQLIGPKEVRIEASYGKDDPVAGAVVRMLAADGARLGERETDAAGTCRFLLNEIGDYTFEVVHSGHRGICTLTQDQWRDAKQVAATNNAESGQPEANNRTVNNEREPAAGPKSNASGGLTNIVAGLGLIFGLFAFVMVLNQRKEIRHLRAELENERSNRP